MARVRMAVEAVPDPELPPVTIGMLGMVHDLEVDDAGRVLVALLPTFAGCPATDMIREDVVAAVAPLPGVTDVEVVFHFTPVWTPDRIDEEGRRRLAEFGIAPPLGASADDDGAAVGLQPPEGVDRTPDRVGGRGHERPSLSVVRVHRDHPGLRIRADTVPRHVDVRGLPPTLRRLQVSLMSRLAAAGWLTSVGDAGLQSPPSCSGRARSWRVPGAGPD